MAMAIAIAGVLVDGPGRNSFDEETYAGYCEGGYGRCVGWSLYHRSCRYPVNCNGLERVRRRGDISLSVLVSTSQYQRYRYYRIEQMRANGVHEASREKKELGVY